MNLCFSSVNDMTTEEAEQILSDPHSPHCLEQAAIYFLTRTRVQDESNPQIQVSPMRDTLSGTDTGQSPVGIQPRSGSDHR